MNRYEEMACAIVAPVALICLTFIIITHQYLHQQSSKNVSTNGGQSGIIAVVR